MKDVGRVKKIKKDKALVEFDVNSKFIPYLNKLKNVNDTFTVPVDNTLNAKVGDKIQVKFLCSTADILIILLRFMPVLLACIGYLIAFLLKADIIWLASSVAIGIVLGTLIASIAEKYLKRNKKLIPKMVAIISNEHEGQND